MRLTLAEILEKDPTKIVYTPEELKEFYREIEAALLEHGFTEQENTFVANELVGNSVEYGNGDDFSKSMIVYFLKQDGVAYIVIQDEGQGFDCEEAKVKHVGAERKHGLAIIAERFVDDMYNFNDNCLYLIKKLKP